MKQQLNIGLLSIGIIFSTLHGGNTDKIAKIDNSQSTSIVPFNQPIRQARSLRDLSMKEVPNAARYYLKGI